MQDDEGKKRIYSDKITYVLKIIKLYQLYILTIIIFEKKISFQLVSELLWYGLIQ